LPHVVAADAKVRQFTGGLSEFDVEAATVRRMILALEDRFPGLGDHIQKSMAIAIDGEIHQDAWGAELKPDSEVYLIPKIGGG
jgi:molybdopterin synthase sulfur carrier subunit